MLELTCLGRPQIQLNQKAVAEFSSNKVFALFIYLALANKPLTRSELEGLLWGGSDAQKGKTSLRSALYNINKQLDGVLETDRKTVTYAAAERTEIDLIRFEQLIAAGTQADLEAACALYTGPFLDRLEIDDAPEFDHWVITLRERYRQLYFESLGKLIDLYLLQGENEKGIEALQALIEVEPWQEGAQRRLMTLLAREGRFNDALKRYERCCVALQDEIGVEPMPETVALYEAILQLRDRPSAKHLPHQADQPLGRERESGVVLNRLLNRTCRLVTLTGMGGVGKTALALATGRRLNRHFMHGVTWVPLAPLENESFLELTILEGLGIAVPPQKRARQHLIDTLRDEERLLVLDNAEHLIDGCADLVSELLAHCGRLSLLVTSREPLALRNEHLVRLHGLPLAAQNDASDGPALILFAERAKRAGFRFELDAANRPAVRKICVLLDGLPLGIELAAAQTAAMSCAEIETQLAARLTDLELSLRDLPPRQRSLRALLDHSWQLLQHEERQLLAALSVFRGPFSHSAALEICGGTVELLAALLQKSLLLRDGDRYALHGVVGRYAAEKIEDESPESLGRLRAAHSGYFCDALGEAVGDRPRSDGADFKKLHAEWYNVQAAWEYLVETVAWHDIGHTAHPLAQFLESNNRFQEGLLLFSRSLDLLTQKPTQDEENLEAGRTRAIVQNRYAVQLVRTGDIPLALETTNRTITALERLDEPMELGFALNLNGACSLLTSDFETAIDRFERCAEIYLTHNVPEALKPLINLGSLYMRTGRYELAIETLEKAISRAEGANDLRGLAHIYNNLGASLILLDRFEDGLRYCNACIEVCDRIDFHTVKVVALQNRAEISLHQNAVAAALASARESLELARTIGAKTYELPSLKWGMLAAAKAGERETVEKYLIEGQALAATLNSPAVVLDWLAGVVLLLAEPPLGIAEVAKTGALKFDLLKLVRHHPATQQPTIKMLAPALERSDTESTGADEGVTIPIEDGLRQIDAWMEHFGLS